MSKFFKFWMALIQYRCDLGQKKFYSIGSWDLYDKIWTAVIKT